MPDGQKHAALRVDGRNVDVTLVDASATGVAIACPLTITLDIDDRAELHTSSGGSVIRIVRKEVFSDGILLGAERLGDLSEAEGWLSQISEFALWPLRTYQGGNLIGKLVATAAAIMIVGGGTAAYFGWNWVGKPAAVTVEAPSNPGEAVQPTPAELHNVLKQVESLIPSTPVVSESDQRAQRIFEQQKQLLTPDTIRRLRLTPSQESQILRALEATKAAADGPAHESWEAIRRSETQILKILTPSQIKIWRQQNGT